MQQIFASSPHQNSSKLTVSAHPILTNTFTIPNDPTISVIHVDRKAKVDCSTFPDLPNLTELIISKVTCNIPLSPKLTKLMIHELHTSELDISHLTNLETLTVKEGYHNFQISLNNYPNLHTLRGKFNVECFDHSNIKIIQCNKLTLYSNIPDTLTELSCRVLDYDQKINIANFRVLELQLHDFHDFQDLKENERSKLELFVLESCSGLEITQKKFPVLDRLSVTNNKGKDFILNHPGIKSLRVSNAGIIELQKECNMSRICVRGKELRMGSLVNLTSLTARTDKELLIDGDNDFPRLKFIDITGKVKVDGKYRRISRFGGKTEYLGEYDCDGRDVGNGGDKD